jgi:hypothetical protein
MPLFFIEPEEQAQSADNMSSASEVATYAAIAVTATLCKFGLARLNSQAPAYMPMHCFRHRKVHTAALLQQRDYFQALPQYTLTIAGDNRKCAFILHHHA